MGEGGAVYFIEWMPRARKDLARLPKAVVTRIEDKIDAFAGGLGGDIVKLTNFIPEYRMRVGVYRVLFKKLDNDAILVYRVRHRKDSYR
ncbi:MAG: type II toxin-antitoxin system RelE/ParE family toxin [Gammaproteobacteria bacterium]